MACKTESKQIGDNEFSVTQWPVDRALITKIKLVKIFGAAFASMATSAEEKPSSKAKASEGKIFSEGLSILFSSSNPEEIAGIIKQSVIGVACNGTRITESTYNELFSGDNMMDLYKVFLFVLQVNYSNLFKGQLADRLLAKVKQNL